MSSAPMQRWYEPRVILVATNLHDPPTLMRHAVAEAKRSGARLLLVHVIPPPLPHEDAAPSPPRVLRLPSSLSASEALEHMALQLQWQGVLCEAVVLKGRPADQIRTLVQSRRVDRVIVANRSSRSGATPHPSVAADLMADLEMPVCVVPGHIDGTPLTHPTASRVLLALSLRTIRREYVDFAFGLAEARSARLTLLHVLDPLSANERDRASAHDAARLRLAALAAAANHENLPEWPDIAVREGDPASQILEQAGCPFQDVIVLGSPSRTSSSAREAGSILRRVIAEARCPVIALKPAFAESRTVADSGWPVLRTGSLN